MCWPPFLGPVCILLAPRPGPYESIFDLKQSVIALFDWPPALGLTSESGPPSWAVSRSGPCPAIGLVPRWAFNPC